VQKIIGVGNKVRQLLESRPQSGNQLSVMMELQADCLAEYGRIPPSSEGC
jgi:predicted metalloprotease